MSEELRPAAITAVSKVLETMFFIFAEPCENQGPAQPPEEIHKEVEVQPSKQPFPHLLRSTIGFQGRTSGEIKFFISYEFARRMAANFMGSEENEVSEPQILDVVGEITNMIAGNLFSLLDKGKVYELSAPKTEMVSGGQMDDGAQDSGLTVDFDADEQRLRLNIQFES